MSYFYITPTGRINSSHALKESEYPDAVRVDYMRYVLSDFVGKYGKTAVLQAIDDVNNIQNKTLESN